MALVATGCGCGSDEDKKDDKKPAADVTCTEYIEGYLEDEGWTRTAEVIFTNKEDNYLVWNVSSNVFVFMKEAGNIELFINNGQIFADNDYATDRFEDLKTEMKYDTYKDFADETHTHFDGLGCPLRGKENNILTEEYKTVYIKE